MLSMIDPQTLAIGGTAIALTGISLRTIFAKVAVGNALKKAQPMIDDFRKTQSAPISSKAKINAKKLTAILSNGEAARNIFVSQLAKLEINDLQEPPSNRLLSKEMAEMGTVLLWGSVGIEAYSFSKNYAEHINAMMTGTEHAAHSVNILDENVIKILDETGVTEFVMQAAKNMGEHVSDQAMEIGLGVLHEAMLPGVTAAFMTIVSESKLAFDGGTNWEDTLLYGALPAIGTFASVKAGMASGAMVDAGTGGATLGLGTVFGGIAGLCGSLFLKKKYIGGQIEEDKSALRPYADRIDAKKSDGIKEVNQVILDKAKETGALRDSCPQIINNAHLKRIFMQISAATSADFATTIKNVTDSFDYYVASLPERSPWEKVLFINKSAAVRSAYHEAAQQQINLLRDTQSKLIEALKTNPSAAADIIATSPILRNAHLDTVLQLMSEDLKDVAHGYDSSLKVWGRRCGDHWETSQRDVKSELDNQKSAMASLRAELSGIINPLRMRIKGNCIRLGRSPDPLIYV